MKPIRSFLIAACALSVAAVGVAQSAGAATVASGSSPKVCSGTLPPGTYPGLVTKGLCIIPKGPVTVAGNVVVTPGSGFDDATPALLTVNGNILVGRGAIAALGCSTEVSKACTTPVPDSFNGNIVATQPLDLIIQSGTISGSVSMTGGGGGKNCKVNPLLKSPNFSDIEDTTVQGNVSFTALRSCWLGIIRDQIHGSLTLLRNRFADPDADEVVTNTIYGNAACRRNSPAPQEGDSHGLTNTVFGAKSGQCRHMP
jgi:hypothetical protein